MISKMAMQRNLTVQTSKLKWHQCGTRIFKMYSLYWYFLNTIHCPVWKTIFKEWHELSSDFDVLPSNCASLFIVWRNHSSKKTWRYLKSNREHSYIYFNLSGFRGTRQVWKADWGMEWSEKQWLPHVLLHWEILKIHSSDYNLAI